MVFFLVNLRSSLLLEEYFRVMKQFDSHIVFCNRLNPQSKA